MRNNKQLRSDCPISFTLDVCGDKWSLLIVRDAVFAGKQTFNDFLHAGEGIARNILANRLTRLVDKGILLKLPHPTDGRKDVYTLTEKGYDLIPVLLSMATWGNKHEAQTNIRQLSPGSYLSREP